MTSEERARMSDLCAQIQSEKDFSRFQELTRQVTELIYAKQKRFPESQFAPSGTCQKVVQATATRTMPAYDNKSELVEIHIADAQPLYSEIRIENSFQDDHGHRLALKVPAALEVKLQAPSHNFTVK